MRKTYNKIRKLREFRNYSQEYMADRLEISQSAYAQLESGNTKLSAERLMKIAEVLDVPVEKFISSEELHFEFHNNNNILNDEPSIINYNNEHSLELYQELLKTKNLLIKSLQEQIEILMKSNKKQND